MRTLTTIFSALTLTLALGCSGGDDDDGNGNEADAAAGQADAAGGGVDAMPSGGSANLGRPCNTTDNPCPSGTCAILQEGATTGMCTVSCTMAGMVDVCGAADGFPGPGVAYCGLGQAPNLSCAVGCGQQNQGDTSCPAGLTCVDAIDGDGTPDLCIPNQ